MKSLIIIILLLAAARVFWWAVNIIAQAEIDREHEDYNWREDK